jgi:hypothetical protein
VGEVRREGVGGRGCKKDGEDLTSSVLVYCSTVLAQSGRVLIGTHKMFMRVLQQTRQIAHRMSWTIKWKASAQGLKLWPHGRCTVLATACVVTCLS